MPDCISVIAAVKPSIPLVVSILEGGIYSTGSGFVFLSSEIVVTCNHVVKDAVATKIKFPDAAEFLDAKIAVRDYEHDLALLKIEQKDRQPLRIANPETIKEGMPVIFAGYPLQMEQLTSHCGILSAIAKDPTGIVTYMIDGTVNSGNSGCPLMNMDGEVIGVVNAKRMERADLLGKVEQMKLGALALHGIDLVDLYQALIRNVQLGIGYAVPASYIPEYRRAGAPLQSAKQSEVPAEPSTQDA